jgi:ureidoglycolate amidohydrolase
VDIRDTELHRRDSVIHQIEEASRTISEKRGVSIRPELLNADPPANCDSAIVDALAQSCKNRGLNFLPMISRAYHDSLFMARIAPVAMLFISCRSGYSHRPDEFASAGDIARGILVLADTLGALSA